MIDSVPDELRPLYKLSIDRCKNIIDGIKDPCDSAYAFEKCCYEGAPEKFINTFD